MIDCYGNWIAEKDYSAYPKDKWCDYDYVASWIKDLGYKSKTSIENIARMVMFHYDTYLADNHVQFYIDNMKKSENGTMVSIKDVSCFVNENGGLVKFDYEC